MNGVGEGFRESEGDSLVDDLINGLIDGSVNSFVNLDCGVVRNQDSVVNPLAGILIPTIEIGTAVVTVAVLAQDVPVAARLRRMQVVAVVTELSEVFLLGSTASVGGPVKVTA